MTQIMVWNIQQFSNNKVNDAAVQACILSTIYAPNPAAFAAGGAVVPDILVVIEVLARPNAVGVVPATSGAVGMATLLGLLQAVDANWRAVPPISLGVDAKTEAIGIFYLQNLVTFTGPHVWCNYDFPIPAAQIAAQTPPWAAEFTAGAPVAAAYPAPWNVAPLAAAGAPAPQVFFPNAAGAAFIQFPAFAFRRPQLTTFTDVGTGNTIELFTFHPSPSNAVAALASVATIPEIIAGPGANTLRVLCGDLNVDAAVPASYAAGYGAFTALGYTPELGTAAASLVNPPAPTFFESGKVTANAYLSAKSLDNFLTWNNGYAPNAAWVVNRVTGAPAPYVTDLANALAAILAMPNAASRAQTFRSWANFGHVGNRHRTGNMNGVQGASDHLPILLQF